MDLTKYAQSTFIVFIFDIPISNRVHPKKEDNHFFLTNFVSFLLWTRNSNKIPNNTAFDLGKLMILIPDNKTTIMTKEAGRTKIDLNISNNRFKKDLHLMKLVSNIFLHSALVTSVIISSLLY